MRFVLAVIISAPIPVFVCNHFDVGKKWKARQRFFWSPANSLKSRYTASPDGSINDHEKESRVSLKALHVSIKRRIQYLNQIKDYRFVLKLSRRFCGDQLLDSIESNPDLLSVTDFSPAYTIEHILKDFDTCKHWVEVCVC